MGNSNKQTVYNYGVKTWSVFICLEMEANWVLS